MNTIERMALIREVGFYLGKGLSQKEIALILGISQQRVSNYRKFLREEFMLLFSPGACI